MLYYKRNIERLILKYLEIFPVIGITGPRQSGKSTVIQHLLTDYTYVTFDDPKIVQHFIEDPDDFMSLYNNHVIFDEAQKAPEIFNYIKMAVDKDRDNYGKFIVTGSSQFSLLNQITESLAGRIGLLTLLPLQLSECPKSSYDELIYKGSYPEVVRRSFTGYLPWFESYVDTYLNKDIRTISNIGNLRDFQRFLILLASNTSTLLNMSEYAKKIGVSVPTIKHWISILEASYIIFLLPPYYNNIGKRLIKSPKVYFYDTGLVCYLTGIETFKHYNQGPMAGSIFENHVITEIIKKALHANSSEKFYFLRTQAGQEVDLIIEDKQQLAFIEIKKNATFNLSMIDNLKALAPSNCKKILLYNGETRKYHNGIEIINFREQLLDNSESHST